jgi:hypothetical protein
MINVDDTGEVLQNLTATPDTTPILLAIIGNNA